MATEHATLVLRLAGPMQAWGGESKFNRRETASLPSKSGIVGLLAAARGQRREDPIEELVNLELGVRIDRPGTVLRDYHTVSDYRGVPLLSAQVDAKGRQRPTAPNKFTGVTQRFYLQDAVFVAAVRGRRDLIDTLAQAVRRPAFPLALGRRSCAPTQPIVLQSAAAADTWDEPVAVALASVPWQAPEQVQRKFWRDGGGVLRLAATVDASCSEEGSLSQVNDLPASFDPKRRAFSSRAVRHIWVEPPLAVAPEAPTAPTSNHNGFELLGVD